VAVEKAVSRWRLQTSAAEATSPARPAKAVTRKNANALKFLSPVRPVLTSRKATALVKEAAEPVRWVRGKQPSVKAVVATKVTVQGVDQVATVREVAITVRGNQPHLAPSLLIRKYRIRSRLLWPA